MRLPRSVRKTCSLSAATIRRETMKAVCISIWASTSFGNLSSVGFSISRISLRGSKEDAGNLAVSERKKRFRRGLTAIAEWCQENRHVPVDEQQKTLNAKLLGHYQYYGRPTNYRSILQFYRESPFCRGFVDRLQRKSDSISSGLPIYLHSSFELEVKDSKWRQGESQ
jgi:hypothetical protein